MSGSHVQGIRLGSWGHWYTPEALVMYGLSKSIQRQVLLLSTKGGG